MSDLRLVESEDEQPEELAALLEGVYEFVREYVVLTDAQAVALTLYIAHTWGIDASRVTPYLWITSAGPASGKTQTLEVLELVVRRPVKAANLSDATLYHVVEEEGPTLLWDEIDRTFGRNSERGELIGLLNSGYKRGGTALRMGGPNRDKLIRYGTFGAKALAGLAEGRLDPALLDRCIKIELRRKRADERIGRFRPDRHPEGDLSHRLAEWAERELDDLREIPLDYLDELSDRAAEVWAPLLAIADLAQEGWPARARQAALTLSGKRAFEDQSPGIRLLADVRRIFEEGNVSRLPSRDLLDALREDEEAPWGEWGRGRGLTLTGLADLLRPFGVRPRTIKLPGGATARGYRVEQFEDVWARWLPPSPTPPSSRHPDTLQDSCGIEPTPQGVTVPTPLPEPSPPETTPDTDPTPANPHEQRKVSGVTGVSASEGRGEDADDDELAGIFDEPDDAEAMGDRLPLPEETRVRIGEADFAAFERAIESDDDISFEREETHD